MLRSRFPQSWHVILGCLAFLGSAPPANAATAAELLEKAIYTEETVGDLDEAIKVYEKVVAEGKAAENLAAQAQLRIGLCYAKLGKNDKATAAFQAVIDNYPQAEDIVAQARERLPREPELLPVPWISGEELHLEMQLPNGMGVGEQIWRISEVERNGKARWECQSWQTVTLNGQAGFSRVLVDNESFAPLESYWKHSMLGEATAKYGQDQVVIKLAGNDEPTTLKFSGQAFDNEQAAEMFRRLPLKEGYKTTVTIVSTLATTIIPLEVNVTKIETIETPAGSFKCFRMELNIGQTFWISSDEHRYIVQFQAGGVIAKLSDIREYHAGESNQLKEDRFSFTLPPDWFAYTPTSNKQDESPTTTLIDPDAIANTRIEAGPLEPIRSEHDSPEEWLKISLKKYHERTNGFRLSEQGIENTTIGGRQAASADASPATEHVITSCHAIATTTALIRPPHRLTFSMSGGVKRRPLHAVVTGFLGQVTPKPP